MYLGRTSPVIEGLASWTLDQALDPVARDSRPVASRCGVVSTSAVSTHSTLLVARFRYHLQMTSADLSALHSVWVQAAPLFPSQSDVEYQVDVDPLNFR